MKNAGKYAPLWPRVRSHENTCCVVSYLLGLTRAGPDNNEPGLCPDRVLRSVVLLRLADLAVDADLRPRLRYSLDARDLRCRQHDSQTGAVEALALAARRSLVGQSRGDRMNQFSPQRGRK